MNKKFLCRAMHFLFNAFDDARQCIVKIFPIQKNYKKSSTSWFVTLRIIQTSVSRYKSSVFLANRVVYFSESGGIFIFRVRKQPILCT